MMFMISFSQQISYVHLVTQAGFVDYQALQETCLKINYIIQPKQYQKYPRVYTILMLI